MCPGADAKEDNRCHACIEKNGIRSRERQGCSSREGEIFPPKEARKERRTPAEGKTSDVAVSTSSRPATEDIGTETSPDEKEKEKDKEKDARDKCKSKSGHARTHAIVINLDDKSRFSEEVTV